MAHSGWVVRLTYACRQAVAGAVAGGPGMTVAGGPGMAVAGGLGMAVAGGPGQVDQAWQ